MRKFDNIKQDLFRDAATIDPDYAQTPQDPRSTSLTNRLLESKARIRDEKIARAREVFGNGNGNGNQPAANKDVDFAVLERAGVTLRPDETRTNQFARFQSDAPSCDNCGSLTVRSGNCYLCHNCGNSLGCS